MTHSEDPFLRVQASFERQGLMRELGARVHHVAQGECTIELPYAAKVTQQQGAFHGGAIGAVADIAAGYAALTLAPAGMEVVTVEYKINFLAACQGGALRAVGRVVKPGRRVMVTSSEVFHLADDGKQTLCALLQQTIMPVAKTY
ncbi:PaaI family thioesterase [Rhodoferax sp.]|uniref:PaaI family thioesterase n=1 Tax=Rhodoferax sp. TaxID=50421 RepID=UPI0026253EFF|nr:PaaI family thioesterase [Rhodoferax sp.]MDD2808520.1 PaaI family thioesterase [Rhodoferax sp.]